MTKVKPTLYIIDGNSYIYRAFYAIRGLTTSKGFPTGAVFGFTNMLMKVASEKKPDYLAVCFDPKGPTTRHGLYTEYKATRPPMPDTLVPQIEYIHRMVDAFNIPVLLMPGIEADDVIAAVARKAEAEGFEVTVVTGDKDLFQIISGGIKIYDTMRDQIYGPLECKERFGVPPEGIPELLGLMGDSSDNIPGVPGVGEKTAARLIAEFGTVEGVMGNLDRIDRPKLRESLRANAEEARLSRRLVELLRDLPDEVDISSLKRRPQDNRRLIELFKDLEFPALLKLIAPEERPAADYRCVMDERELRKIVAAIKAAGECAVDTETTSVLPMQAELVGLSLCYDESEAFYVPLGHVEGDKGDLFPAPVKGQIPMAKALEILKPVLEDAGIKKYGHNIKYDIIVLKNAGVELRGVSFDSMVGSYLLNPGRASHSMDNVALEHLSMRTMTYAEAAGAGLKQVLFSHVGLDTATRYSAEDAHVTYMLTRVLRKKLRESGLARLFEEMELPLIPVLAEIEMNGVYVDTDCLLGISKELEVRLDSLMRRIHAIAGGEFNINSPKQLAELLFVRLGLTPLRKTKTGYSTDEETLTYLAASHELPAEILNYRELFKLKSTYVDALSRLVNPKTGRVHTSLNQAVTATGRLSSSDPNLQNIPIRTEMGRRIRQAFAAPKGRVIVSADYSQVELRIMAHLSGDPSLIESFRMGEDVHSRTASEIFGIAPDAVTDEMRRKAKAVNFGIMYGMGAYGLSAQIGVHPKDAKKYIDAYFERHAGVREFIERNLGEVAEKGYSTTLSGRKRPIPELGSDNKNTRAQGERLAINTPIQGAAADIIKAAMINISRRLKAGGLKSIMILQVHDELVFEAPEGEAEEMKRLVREEMEGVVELAAPLKVDIGAGPNWGEAH